MDKQKLTDITRSYAATLAANEVSSLRIKEDKRTVIRVYEGGNIGIAGRIGDGDDITLEKQATEVLTQNIPYVNAMTSSEVRDVDLRTDIIAESDFLNVAKHFAARLKERFPNFMFSNKFILEEMSSHYEDSSGTNLSYADRAVRLGLTIKTAESANIMDLSYAALVRSFDENEIISDMAKLLDVYSNVLPMPEEKLPIIIDTSIIAYALSHVIAEMYESGASLFAGKLGEKLFSDKVDILIDRTPGKDKMSPFFDMEGVTLPDDKFYFVKEGVFSNLATYRRSAAAFNRPLSGCGYADFDDVPQCGYFKGIELATHGQKLSDVFSGRAIYIAVTSGGDMTPDGKVATPVMLAYLYEDGKLVGRLSEFGISANIFDFLGKDLIVVAKNDMFSYMDEDVIVAYFNVDKSN